MLLEYLLFTQQKMNTSLISEVETEEILSEETNHLFAKILKELAHEAYLIA